MNKAPKPVVLCILDGWGYRTDMKNNAVMAAETPNFEEFKTVGACTLLKTSGLAVGLPDGQMGNSEVGHINIGAGRVVYQDLTRISKSFEEGEFAKNPVILNTLNDLKASGKALHIFGLLSDGGVHADEAHIHGLIKVAAELGLTKIYLHAFLDGRDTAPRSAETYIERAEAVFSDVKVGRFATIIGRYFAMDRDNRWERVEQAYDLLSQGKGEFHANSAMEGLKAAYDRNENDEFVKSTVIGEAVKMEDGDAVIFMNFRSDRAREITYPFTEDDFNGFAPKYRPKLSHYVCLTLYKDTIHAEIAFPPQKLVNGLGEVLAKHNLTQLRLAETEKYPHVTFFFNGGREQVFTGEDRIMVNSPKVATYDLQPEMSAPEVADNLVEAILSQKFDVIICNFANPDMVGHTGVFDAIVTAVETVDDCMGRVYDAILEVDGELLVTADHGNAELTWDDATNQPHTAHTTGPVPFIYLGRNAVLAPDGALKDIAPTILHLLGIEQPIEMTGKSLIHFK